MRLKAAAVLLRAAISQAAMRALFWDFQTPTPMVCPRLPEALRFPEVLVPRQPPGMRAQMVAVSRARATQQALVVTVISVTLGLLPMWVAVAATQLPPPLALQEAVPAERA